MSNIVEKVSWTDLKAFITARSASLQWIDETSRYIIYAVDGPYTYSCLIPITDPAGTDQSDFEDNYQSSGNQAFNNLAYTGDRLKTDSQDLSNDTGVQGALTVGTSAVVAKVGGSNLANRKYLTVFNNGNQLIYWGRTSGVTTSTGTPIYKKQLATFRVGPDASVYLISGSAGQNIRITEQS